MKTAAETTARTFHWRPIASRLPRIRAIAAPSVPPRPVARGLIAIC